MPESPDIRVLKQSGNTDSVIRALRTHFDSPLAHCKVTAAAENTDARRITLQVRDRIQEHWEERWLVTFYLTATTGGDPSATGNTVAFVAGTVFQTVTANAAYVVLSDENGRVVFDLTIAGAASRFVCTSVAGGRIKESIEFTWAA